MLIYGKIRRYVKCYYHSHTPIRQISMLNFIMLLLVIEGPLVVQNNNVNNQGIKMYDLQGPVKSLHQHYYVANGKQGAVVKGAKLDSTAFDVMFDKKGNILEIGGVAEKTIFNYDSAGRNTGVASYTENKLSSTTIFIYNTGGNLIEENTAYRNDDSARPVKITYKYDAQDRVIEAYGNFYTEGKFGGERFNYDKNGHVVIEKYFVGNSNTWIVQYKYDTHGNVIEMNESYGGTRLNWVFEYVYDNKGNYTTQTAYKWETKSPSFDELPYGKTVTELKPVQIIERSIEYY